MNNKKSKTNILIIISIITLLINFLNFTKAETISRANIETKSIYTWGFMTNNVKPKRVVDSTNVVAKIVAKGGFGYIDTNGDLYTWGGNRDGQLGIGTNTFTPNPTRVSLPGKVKDAWIGTYYSGAILENGDLYMWGKNDRGQLGNGTNLDTNVPVKVLMPEPVVSFSFKSVSYISTTGAVTESGNVYIWGDDIFKGDVTISNIPKLINVSSVGTIKSIAIGTQHALILNTDGDVYAFGNGAFGVLATKNENDVFNQAVKVDLNGEKISKIQADYYISGALSEKVANFIYGE